MKYLKCHQCGGPCNINDWCEACNGYGKDRLRMKPDPWSPGYYIGVGVLIFFSLLFAAPLFMRDCQTVLEWWR